MSWKINFRGNHTETAMKLFRNLKERYPYCYFITEEAIKYGEGGFIVDFLFQQLQHQSGVAGITRITVLASGFAGSSSILTSVLYPLSVTLLSSEIIANITGTTEIHLSVQSSGVSVPDAKVSWSSASGSILNEINSTDTKGIATAEFQHSTSSAVNVTATVSKNGYQNISKSILVDIDLLPLSLSLPVGELKAIAALPLEISATALSNGQPISDAILNWESIGGIITSPVVKTSGDGVGSTVFSNIAGNFTISVSIEKPGYITTTNTISVAVSESIDSTDTLTTEESGITIFGLDLVAILGLVVAIVVVGVVIVLVLRRRFRKSGDEELVEDDLGELLEEE